MKNLIVYLGLACICLISSAAGCSNPADPSPSSSSESIEGTWKLTKIDGQSTSITNAQKGTTMTIYFDTDFAFMLTQNFNLELKNGQVRNFRVPVQLNSAAAGIYELGKTGGINFTLDKSLDNRTPLPNGTVVKWFGYYKISGKQLILTQTKADFVASSDANNKSTKDLQTYDLTLTYTKQ